MALYYDELLIKTLVADSAEEIDRKCNEFNKTNSVKAMHSNIVYGSGEDGLIFVYTLFYLPKADMPKPVTETEVKKEPISAKIPSVIVPETQALWTNCTICNSRWKFTHYRMCPQRHGLEGLPVENKVRYMEIWNGDGNGNKGANTSTPQI